MNCARTLGKRLTEKIVRGQERELAVGLAGQTVVRAGQTLTVEAVRLNDREVVVTDMQGGRDTLGFDDFFDERVVVVEPDVLLEPVRAEAVAASWTDRYLYRRGERWKVLRVNRPADLPEALVTVQSDEGALEVHSATELATDGWQVRRNAKPNVAQRLAGVYKTRKRK